MNKLSNKPLYDQVFDQIKDMIRSGTYCAGDQLPSEKELMERMGSQQSNCPPGTSPFS